MALSTLEKNSKRTQADEDELTGLMSHKIPSYSALPGRIIFPVKLLQNRPLGIWYYYSSVVFGEWKKGLKTEGIVKEKGKNQKSAYKGYRKEHKDTGLQKKPDWTMQ